ncbi:hypothetical protein DLM78_16805 [Leptospira stimsonii]|uniref:Uncharacterized protein n=1 Tax=Leptospira stimsonii TaxID=2202203 RepID=A0A8B3CLM8_9LEPT|nr:hypothetical protein DLM78_16805 [Leptospira stimsonii]
MRKNCFRGFESSKVFYSVFNRASGYSTWNVGIPIRMGHNPFTENVYDCKWIARRRNSYKNRTEFSLS